MGVARTLSPNRRKSDRFFSIYTHILPSVEPLSYGHREVGLFPEAGSQVSCGLSLDFKILTRLPRCLHDEVLPIVVWSLSPNGRSPHPDVLPYSVYATLVQCPWHLFFSFEMTLAGLDEKLGFISPGTYVNEVYMLRCGFGVCFIPVVLSNPSLFCMEKKKASCSSGHAWWRFSAGTLSRGQDYISSRDVPIDTSSLLPSSR